MVSFIKRFLLQLQYCPELLFVFHLFGVLFSAPTLEQYIFKVFSDEVGYNYTYDASTANDACSNDLKNSTSLILLKEVFIYLFIYLSIYLFIHLFIYVYTFWVSFLFLFRMFIP